MDERLYWGVPYPEIYQSVYRSWLKANKTGDRDISDTTVAECLRLPKNGGADRER